MIPVLACKHHVYIIAIAGNSNSLYSGRGQGIRAIAEGALVPVSRVRIQKALSNRNSD